MKMYECQGRQTKFDPPSSTLLELPRVLCLGHSLSRMPTHAREARSLCRSQRPHRALCVEGEAASGGNKIHDAGDALARAGLPPSKRCEQLSIAEIRRCRSCRASLRLRNKVGGALELEIAVLYN